VPHNEGGWGSGSSVFCVADERLGVARSLDVLLALIVHTDVSDTAGLK
jgi:hypothetical protein